MSQNKNNKVIFTRQQLQNADIIIGRLYDLIGEAKSELNYKTPFQLLIAVILSAQCTDTRVNIVTKDLFAVADTPQKLASMDILEIENILQSLGFYHNKAKNIKQCAIQIINDYNGQVVPDREELVKLAGVGQKTANVVLMECFGMPYIAVDTHVYRVSHRLGLSSGKTPYQVEEDLYNIIDSSKHKIAHHTILLFGRYYCKAQKPKCDNCVVREFCLNPHS